MSPVDFTRLQQPATPEPAPRPRAIPTRPRPARPARDIPRLSMEWLVHNAASNYKRYLPACPACGNGDNERKRGTFDFKCSNCGERYTTTPPASWAHVLEVEIYLDRGH